MSQHIYTAPNGATVMLGYDRPLNYVFCTVYGQDDDDEGGGMVYSNLSDPAAGTIQQDVDYYRLILEKLGYKVPEAMFTEVKADQAACAGNRQVFYSDGVDR